jgi:hypothetical protein
MPSRIDMQCQSCGIVREFVFEHVPPATQKSKCLLCDRQTTWDRVWTPPHTGRGSSGEPAR